MINRPGATAVSGDLRFDTVDWRDSPEDAFWLPKKLHRRKMGVRFMRLLDIQQKPLVAVFDEDSWTLVNSFWDVPYVTLSLPLLSGEILLRNSLNFCFDFIEDVGRVLLVEDAFLQDYAVKCCYPGEIISPKGYCVKHNGSDWTPGSSEVKDRFDPTVTPASIVKLPTTTQCTRFTTLPINSSEAIQNLSGKFTTHKERWKTVYYCNDFQMTHDGQQEEVVGRCVDSPSAEVFESVLPLKVVSALLLVGAALAAVLQEDTRRCAHGRALACHALCLAAANALQVTWAFWPSKRFDTSCDNYFYSVYFFMTAGNFWLTSITVNMAKGFRQPLGAMAKAARLKDDAVVWKHFGYMSLFAWGCSILLTVFALAMHRHRKQVEKLGFVAPSFFETRTCAREFHHHARYGEKTPVGDRLGSLFYYFVPMVLLVVTNGVCVILTARIVNSLQRDKAFLQRDTTDQKGCLPHGVHQNALLYAKLLFTAGIAELALEAVAWGLGSPQRTEQFRMDFLHSFEKYYIFHITTIFLDLVRAATVFWLCCGKQFRGIGVILKKIQDGLASIWEGSDKQCNSPGTELELK